MGDSAKPSHPKSFTKYMSASTGRQVLMNSTLRWSSPVLFNDPFDVPKEIAYGITPADIYKALGEKMYSLIENPPNDTAHLKPEIRKIIESVRGKTIEVRKRFIEESKKDPDPYQPDNTLLQEFQDLWRRLLPDFRILCLTESHTHTAMWMHYADKYSGLALVFDCSEKLDSAWREARPVSYGTETMSLFTAEGWAEIFTLPDDIARKRILELATYTKSSDWSYEKEWRITSYKRPNDTGPYTDYRFDPKELSHIYLGPLIETADVDHIKTLATKYPNAHLTQVKIGMGNEFVFNELSD